MARGSSSRDGEWTPYQHSYAPAARMDDLQRLARLGDGVEDAYKIEYSPSGRAACNGRQPCKGTKIAKGELRLGVWVDFGSEYGGSWKMRHWGCVADRQLANMNIVYGRDASKLLGFDQLDSEDQHMITKAFETGAVDSEDRSALAPAPSPPPMATRSSPRKREHEEYQARYGGGGDSGKEEATKVGDIDGTPGEPDEGDAKEEEVKPELVEPPKKRTRGRAKNPEVKAEEKEDLKPVAEAAEAVEDEDVKPKKQPKVEKQPAVNAEEQIEDDVKPKRSLRSRKPPAHVADERFVQG